MEARNFIISTEILVSVIIHIKGINIFGIKKYNRKDYSDKNIFLFHGFFCSI